MKIFLKEVPNGRRRKIDKIRGRNFLILNNIEDFPSKDKELCTFCRRNLIINKTNNSYKTGCCQTIIRKIIM